MLDMPAEPVKTHFEQIHSQDEYSALLEKQKQIQEKLRSTLGDEYFQAFMKKAAQIPPEKWGEYGEKGGKGIAQLMIARANKLAAESNEVQELMKEEWTLLQTVYPETHSRKIYFAIRDQVCDYPSELLEVQAFRDFHYKAMTVFGEQSFDQE